MEALKGPKESRGAAAVETRARRPRTIIYARLPIVLIVCPNSIRAGFALCGELPTLFPRRFSSAIRIRFGLRMLPVLPGRGNQCRVSGWLFCNSAATARPIALRFTFCSFISARVTSRKIQEIVDGALPSLVAARTR